MKMFRITLPLLTLLLCVLLCACSTEQFELSYSAESDTVRTKEAVRITATVKNVARRAYRYEGAESDFRADAELFYEASDGKTVRIHHEPAPSTTDTNRHTVESGRAVSYTYTFVIPDSVPDGTRLSLRLSFLSYSRVCPDVLTVTADD